MRTSIVSHVRHLAEQLRDIWRRVRNRWGEKPAVRLVVRTVQELGADEASYMSAAIAYYGVLSWFPLILGLTALLSLFLSLDAVHGGPLIILDPGLPGGIEVIEDSIEDVMPLRGVVGAFSLILLLWSASRMFGAIGRAINRCWDIHQDRPFYMRKMRDLAMVLGTGVLFLLSFGATSLFAILRAADLPVPSIAFDFGVRIFGFLLTFAIFLILYRYIPATKIYWRNVWPGALLAAVLFEIAETLWVLYLNNFASYESVYGSFASIIILLIWIYISAFILIIGAEFSSEYGRMREGASRGSPPAISPRNNEYQ